MEAKRTQKRFELTPFSNKNIGDKETIELLLIREFSPDFQDFLRMNREIYGGTEIFDSLYYYSLVTFVEDGFNFTLLNPYMTSFGKYPKRNFAFGVYNPKTNSLYSFFDGKATTNERKTAMMVHNSLVRYCEVEYPDYIPFAIKL